MSAAEPPVRRSRRPALIGVVVVLLVVAALVAYPAIGYVRGSWHWKKAHAAMQARDFRTAEQHLEVCRRVWPENAEVALISARNARQASDLSAARGFLADAHQLQCSKEQLDLEETLLNIQSGTDYSAIGRLLESVQRGDPNSVLIFEVLVPGALHALDFALAAECLDRWVNIEPKSGRP